MEGGDAGVYEGSAAANTRDDPAAPDGRASHAGAEMKDLLAARRIVIKGLKAHRLAVAHFVPALLESLAPVDPAESRQLLKRLSTVVQAGAAPSFADAGARSGYIRRRMEHRSAQVAIFLQHPHMHLALSSLLNAQDSSPYTVASIGGAGGSDAVGLILVRNGLAVHRDGAGAPQAAVPAHRPLRVWVYDLEEGWSDAVQAVTRSLQRVGVECAGDAVGFSTCDCTHSLTHASNTHLARQAVDLDLVVFSFVLAENAVALQAAGFSFLAGLLQVLKPSALVLILDCTFKLFPEIESVASMQGWQALRPAWPADINGHCKSVMVLRRGA